MDVVETSKGLLDEILEYIDTSDDLGDQLTFQAELAAIGNSIADLHVKVVP